MNSIKLEKNKIIALCIAVMTVIAIICITAIKNNTKEDYQFLNEVENKNDIELSNISAEDSNIFIHIAGEVNNPGIVEVEEGSRISDVINMANGLTESADIQKVNLAYVVQDGQKITIPSINEKKIEEGDNSTYITFDAGQDVAEGEGSVMGKVNINTAQQTELETLSGIGPSLASKIIEHRNRNGKFKTIEELKNVSGIGGEKYENIKDSIVAK